MWGLVKLLRGAVKEVDKTLCRFTVKTADGKVCEVNAALIETELPAVDGEVSVKDSWRNATEGSYYLNGESSLAVSGGSGISTGEQRMHNLARAMEWDIDDLSSFMKKRVGLARECCVESVDELNVELVGFLLEAEKSVRSAIFSTTSDVHYVDFKHECVGDFSHGIHRSGSDEVLVGCFRTNASSFFELTDGKWVFYLKINSTRNHSLLHFTNKIVCIKKFTVITEMYSGGVNYEFILCDARDFKVLNIKVPPENHVKHYINREVPFRISDTLTVKIINISLPTTRGRQKECWISVLMREENNWKKANLCLDKTMFSTLPFLDSGCFYKIHSESKLTLHADPEINRLDNNPTSYKIPGECVFVSMTQKEIDADAPALNETNIIVNEIDLILNEIDLETVLTMSELFQAVREGKKRYVNFEAVITRKLLCESFRTSRTPRQTKSSLFGTPGNKQHVLIFKDDLAQKKISFYLNNWERKQVPLGLIPRMRVLVWHAEINKTYLKSNAFTTIHLIEHTSPVLVNSANLNPENGRVFYADLGAGIYIPSGFAVRAKPTSMQIKTFKLIYKNSELILSAVFHSTDATFCADINCDSLDLLRKMFFNTKDKFGRFMNVMAVIGCYDYSAPPSITLPPEHREFYEIFTVLLKANFKHGCVTIDGLYTRDDNFGEKIPLWTCKQIYEVENILKRGLH